MSMWNRYRNNYAGFLQACEKDYSAFLPLKADEVRKRLSIADRDGNKVIDTSIMVALWRALCCSQKVVFLSMLPSWNKAWAHAASVFLTTLPYGVRQQLGAHYNDQTQKGVITFDGREVISFELIEATGWLFPDDENPSTVEDILYRVPLGAADKNRTMVIVTDLARTPQTVIENLQGYCRHFALSCVYD